MKIDQTWTLQCFFEMSSVENDKTQNKRISKTEPLISFNFNCTFLNVNSPLNN